MYAKGGALIGAIFRGYFLHTQKAIEDIYTYNCALTWEQLAINTWLNVARKQITLNTIIR